MRHDQSQGIAVIGRKRLAVMVSGKEHLFAIKIDEWHVSGKTLFGMDHHKLRVRLRLHQFEDFLKGDTLPVVTKAAPAGNTMKIAVRLDLGQLVEFIPFEPNWLLHQAANLE